MKTRLLCFFLGLCAAASHAYTITGEVRRVTLRAATTQLLFTPRTNTVPQAIGDLTVIGPETAVRVTNGLFSVTLASGVYDVTWTPPVAPVVIVVPAGEGTNSFNALATNLQTFAYTNAWLSRPSSHVLAGTNLTSTTNNAGLPDEQVILGAAATGLVLHSTTNRPTVPGLGGVLWASNKVLYWLTETTTNLVSDGR